MQNQTVKSIFTRTHFLWAGMAMGVILSACTDNNTPVTPVSSSVPQSSVGLPVSSTPASSGVVLSSGVKPSSSSVINPNLSSVVISSSAIQPSSSSVTLGTVTNPQNCAYNASANTLTCAEKTYKTVVIGTQTWMAENLNYLPPGRDKNGAWCFLHDENNCTGYGRLYDWGTVMGFAENGEGKDMSAQIKTPHQGICPVGWHVPTDGEWTILVQFLGDSALAAPKLKSTAMGGDNSSGFNALAAGGYQPINSSGGGGFTDYKIPGTDAYFWSSTQSIGQNSWDKFTYSWRRMLSRIPSLGYVARARSGKNMAFSLRCMKD